MKILLLEDDKLLADAIRRYMQSIGHMVSPLRNGLEAFNQVQTQTYDLLILDINVPGIDGLAFLEKLQALRINVPVIYISALVDIEDISKAYALGCHDYLKKPFHLKELTLRINRILQTQYVPPSHVRLSKYYSFDKEAGVLYFQSQIQTLSRRQTQIIALLAHNRSRVVSYEMFCEYVYHDLLIDVPTIRAEINRLKKVLKENFIVNVRGMGYMVERPD